MPDVFETGPCGLLPLHRAIAGSDDATAQSCGGADAGPDPGAGVGLRPPGPQGARQGVPEQARARHGRAGRREGPEGPPPGVLRLLRLALVRPRPLDARAAAPPLPRPAGGGGDPGRAGRTT